MKYFFSAHLLLLCFCTSAQVYGVVTDESGEALPFVSIYVKGTSIGTSSNPNGEYKLDLNHGDFDLVFQYIGLQTKIVHLEVSENPIKLNVLLTAEATLLNEVVVAADAEDPAYRVIRKAIEKRKYYLNRIRQFSCDVYVKGNIKLLSAPEKVLGVEVGDFEGALDSNRQGMVYLSESISKLYFQMPDQLKEVVYSSKISGNDRGYSFNSAREMEFNVYKNTIDFNRALVSPIASNAMSYYRYRLEGTFYNEDNLLINKIRIIPKRKSDPVLYGTIYIIEDLWSIHSVDVGVTAQSSQLYFIDSLRVNQIFIPIEKPDAWRIFNNNISYLFSGFGFKLEGSFTANYSNYDLYPDFENGFFNREIFRVEKESNERDSTYWEENRPTPLTNEEKIDYIKKDSIQMVRDDPVYKDSIDRINNTPSLANFLGGYTYSRSAKHFYWNLDSPLSHLSFNTVQGFRAGLQFGMRKYFDEDETRRILFTGNLDYGFAEEKFRTNVDFVYRPDRLTGSYLRLTGGTSLKQVNKFSPIDEFRNSLYTVFVKRNYAKYYDYKYFKIGAGRDITNALRVSALLGYEGRSALINHSDFSFFYKDNRKFTSNNPLNPNTEFQNEPLAFESHKVWALDLNVQIRFKQDIYVYPDRKFGGESKGPVLRMNYRLINGIGTGINMHSLKASAEYRAELGAYGYSQFYLQAGQILFKRELEFLDFLHFQGNQFTLSNPNIYRESFLMLPYYTHSTDGGFLQFHYEHNFNGFILDKISTIRGAGFGLVGGVKFLKSKGHKQYSEIHLGLDKIGWHIFRILRLDVVMSIDGSNTDVGYRIGIKI